MEKLLTIGIVVYNNEPFINILLYNISQQVKKTPDILKYVEFNLVDDKSTDFSYQKDIPRYITYYRNAINIGSPGMNRNMLIEKANSEYILFVDGDDELRNIYDLCMELINKKEDIILSEVVKLNKDGLFVQSPFIFTKDLFHTLISEQKKRIYAVHQTGLWNIYKVAFVKKFNIFYPNTQRYEDNIFNYKILLKNPSISIVSVKYYYWRMNYNSFTYKEDNYKYRLELYDYCLKNLLKDKDSIEVSAWILYSLWNQTYVNILRNYEKITFKDSFKYIRELNTITKKNLSLVKLLNKKLDYKNVKHKYIIRNLDKRFGRSFLFLYSIQQINILKRHKTKIKKNLLKIFAFLPINSNKIFFTSHYGEYSDNPKYKYLQFKKDPKFKNKKLIFAVKEDYNNKPDFINYNNKVKFYFHLYTSNKYYFNSWVDPDLKKRKKQKWIQLWHGYPYKKLYKDIEIFNKVNSKKQILNKENNIKKWDEIYVLDANNKTVFSRLFKTKCLNSTGYPRIKWLIENKNNLVLKNKIKEKYNLDKNSKYTLYAPTYRSYEVYLQFLEIQKIKTSNYKILFHPHPLIQYVFTDGTYLQNTFENSALDIQEILLIIDELITDYSSIQYDFKMISNNIKFYQPDYRLYSKVNGIY